MEETNNEENHVVNSDHSQAAGNLKLKINTHLNTVKSVNGTSTENHIKSNHSPTKNGIDSDSKDKDHVKSVKHHQKHTSSKENSSEKHKEHKKKEHSSSHHHSSSKHKSSKDSSSKSHSSSKSSSSKDKSHNHSSSHKSSKEHSHSSSHKEHATDKHKEHKSESKHSSSEKKSSHSDKEKKSHSEKKSSHSDKEKKSHSSDHSSHKHKVKEEKSHVENNKHEKLSKSSPVRVKTEPIEHKSNSEDLPFAELKSKAPQIKKEVESDDEEDIPLAHRKPKTEEKHDVKKVKVKKEKEEAPQVKRKYVESDSDDEPLMKRANKVKSSKPDKKRRSESISDSASKKKKLKKESSRESVKSPKKEKKEKEEPQVWKWWEEEKKDEGVKWTTLEHKGPYFAPPYEPLPSNVKFKYDGSVMKLSEPAEEVAGFYARMIEHEYTTKDVFNNNFFHDWRKVMTSDEKETIKVLSKCNFKQIHLYYKEKSEERKNMSKEEKLKIKQHNEELVEEYGFCTIDGHKEKIGNFRIEPPGLFRGRGEHPKMGKLKRRIVASDIIINCGKDSNIPKAPDGKRWKEVRHDNKVTWLVSWNENIQGQTKYVMLNPSSKLKGEKDYQKYETARNLKKHVDKIRSDYTIHLRSKEMKERQTAVALYFIDKLALRAGNEKDDESADTVGCCSLRVEHIKLHPEQDGNEYVVEFDFLGKDSIRYQNSVPVEKRVFKNLQIFLENKEKGDDLFDRLNTTILNKYLNDLMPGLTAKVFRTYNASKTLQEQLDELTQEDMSMPEKILSYNRANRAVAILCNHQRAVPKTFGKQMENLQKKLDDKKDAIKAAKKDVKSLKQSCKGGGNTKDRALLERKKKTLSRLEEQLVKLEVQATDKEENKQIALGTSKLNYLDPRISVAWCKKWEVPMEKIYNKTQRDKFRWAIEMAGPDFHF